MHRKSIRVKRAAKVDGGKPNEEEGFMFWVDDSRQERTARIKSFLNKEDAVVAVLLSTANIEWTLRRAIIGLGSSANMEIRNGVLHRSSGLDGYSRPGRMRFTQGSLLRCRQSSRIGRNSEVIMVPTICVIG
jgi:hypothetical protein